MGGGRGQPKGGLAQGGKTGPGGGAPALGHSPELVHPPGGPLAAHPPGGQEFEAESAPPLGHTAPIPGKEEASRLSEHEIHDIIRF